MLNLRGVSRGSRCAAVVSWSAAPASRPWSVRLRGSACQPAPFALYRGEPRLVGVADTADTPTREKRIREYVERLAGEGPPLSSEQRDELTLLIRRARS